MHGIWLILMVTTSATSTHFLNYFNGTIQLFSFIVCLNKFDVADGMKQYSVMLETSRVECGKFTKVPCTLKRMMCIVLLTVSMVMTDSP